MTKPIDESDLKAPHQPASTPSPDHQSSVGISTDLSNPGTTSGTKKAAEPPQEPRLKRKVASPTRSSRAAATPPHGVDMNRLRDRLTALEQAKSPPQPPMVAATPSDRVDMTILNKLYALARQGIVPTQSPQATATPPVAAVRSPGQPEGPPTGVVQSRPPTRQPRGIHWEGLEGLDED